VLGGVWHGASWNFVIWGALHGAGLVFAHLWRTLRPGKSTGVWRYVNIAITFHFVTFAWIFFRAPDLETALSILERIGSLTVSFANVSAGLAFILLLAIFAHYVPKKWYDWSLTTYARAPFYAQAFALVMLVVGIQNALQTGVAPFIYTRF
jgi:alginate O-acetyltransferase complex protein AlgI